MVDHRGKVVKIISFLLTDLPDSCFYKAIFMRRNLDEVLASQNKMLVRRGEDGGGTDDGKMKCAECQACALFECGGRDGGASQATSKASVATTQEEGIDKAMWPVAGLNASEGVSPKPAGFSTESSCRCVKHRCWHKEWPHQKRRVCWHL